MARIRSIKPEFWTDEMLAELPRDTRLLFIGLWNHVDDSGRCVFNPKLIKAAIFPLDDDLTAETIRLMIDELSTKDRVRVYEVSGRQYLSVLNFTKHQKIDHAKPSALPSPDDGQIVDIVPDQTAFDEPSPKDQRSVTEPSSPDRDQGSGIREVDQGVESAIAVIGDPDIEGLCQHLVQRISDHSSTPPLKIKPAWRKDMQLLRDKGPLHSDKPTPIGSPSIHEVIDAVFDHLATRNSKRFCWADQIRSPYALRDHWWQLAAEFKKSIQPALNIDASIDAVLNGKSLYDPQ